MIHIRHAIEGDLERLTEINNHYILNTNATFDIEPQRAQDRKPWFQRYKMTGPYQLLVAESDGIVVGCAYSSRYREHFAFDRTVETSIYIAPDHKARGLGSRLYEALFSRLRDESLHLAVVGIAIPNEASIALHKKFGFQEVGVFQEYAFKKGHYISSVWMQKNLKGDSE